MKAHNKAQNLETVKHLVLLEMLKFLETFDWVFFIAIYCWSLKKPYPQQIYFITPLSTQISASKFRNLSQIPLKIRGVSKNCGVSLKNSLKIWKLN